MTKFNQQEYTFWIQKDLRRLSDQKHNVNVQVSTLLTCWYFFDSDGLLFCLNISFYLPTRFWLQINYMLLAFICVFDCCHLKEFFFCCRVSWKQPKHLLVRKFRQFLWISIWMKTLCLLMFCPLTGLSCQYMTIQNDYHVNNIGPGHPKP